MRARAADCPTSPEGNLPSPLSRSNLASAASRNALLLTSWQRCIHCCWSSQVSGVEGVCVGTFHASFRFVESTSTARTCADHHDARVQQQCLPERQRRRWCLFFASSGMSLQHNVPLIIITTILSHDAYTGLVNGATSAPCLGGCVGAGGVAPRC